MKKLNTFIIISILTTISYAITPSVTIPILDNNNSYINTHIAQVTIPKRGEDKIMKVELVGANATKFLISLNGEIKTNNQLAIKPNTREYISIKIKITYASNTIKYLYIDIATHLKLTVKIINKEKENHQPVVNSVKIKGNAKVGQKIKLDYVFSDVDGDWEGESIIAWSTKTQELQRSTSKTFIIPKGYEGDSIGAWIHPRDEHGLEGKVIPASNNMLHIEDKKENKYAPTVSHVKIKGQATEGKQLTLNYIFSDRDGDWEKESIVIWSTLFEELQRSTSKTFKVPKNHNGIEIGAWIIPRDAYGLEGKTYAASNNMLTIAGEKKANKFAPIVRNVKIKGIGKVGNSLNLTYSFSDKDGDNEGQSIIAWSTATKELQRGTSKTFVIPQGYSGDSIGAWIHPKDEHGLEGKMASAQNNMLRIQGNEKPKNHAPTVSNVEIMGEAKIANTLSLNYTFNDIDGDNEGSSLIVWKSDEKELQRGLSKSFYISDELKGKKIGASISPVDTKGLKGKMIHANNNMLRIKDADDHNSDNYEEEIILPSYDVDNPKMFLISTDEDWKRINDPKIQYFFITPGDYSSAGHSSSRGSIRITASGTQNAKRYIILHNGNNKHAGKLSRNQLAKVGFILENANYWVIDRMAYWDSSGTMNPIIISNSDHNIINRYYMHDVGSGIYLYPNSDYNTIQNCRVERDHFQTKHDRAAFGLFNNHLNNVSITNNKIINNESRNFVDAFQSIRQPATATNINYEGTIVDGNHFYIDSTVYTDCHGNHDPKGECAYAENPLDLKVGSSKKNNPMIISNNMMWGYRKSDTTNSHLSDNGTIIPIHGYVDNTIIRDNVSFDSRIGFSIADTWVGKYAMSNSIIENNIFYDIHKYTFYLADTKNLIFRNNLIKNSAEAYPYWMFLGKNNNQINFNHNLVSNTQGDPTVFQGGELDSISSQNGYHKATAGEQDHIADNSDILYQVDPTSNYKDLVFTTDRYTNNPRTIRIPKVLKHN